MVKFLEGRSNLFVRVLTAVAGLPVLVAVIGWGPSWLWSILAGLAMLGGLYEWMGMASERESRSVRLISAMIASIPYWVAVVFVGGGAYVRVDGVDDLTFVGVSAALVMWLGFMYHSYRGRDISRAGHMVSLTLSGALYAGLGFLFLALLLRDFDSYGSAWIFTLMGMTWGSDTGAYFSGRAFGKHRLAPILSPKKTWEGAIGGFLCAILAGFIAKWLVFEDLSVLSVVVLASVSNILAQSGDLAESLVKRSFGIKDSGRLIPGHGGMLDRVDALLFSAPWVYFFADFCAF